MKTRGRPVEIGIQLNGEARQELRLLARQALGRVSERAHFVLLSDQGKTVAVIASLMGYSDETVYTWLARYQRLGSAGLQDEPRSGRPRQLQHLNAMVQAQASQSPRCFGYEFGSWSVVLLALQLCQRFQVKVSVASLRRALSAVDFVWGRPKLVLPKRRDSQTSAKLARLQQALTQPEATLVAQDECEMQLLPILRAMWHRRGQQPRVPTPGQNPRRPVFGAVNLRTGAWHYRLTQRKRGQDFVAFLSWLLNCYPVGPIYVLVDNASIHTSRLVLAWLAQQPRLELIYLPTYTGHQYNPVEKVWWQLKHKIAANRCFKNLAELDQAIQRHFAHIVATDMLTLINSPTVRQARLPQTV